MLAKRAIVPGVALLTLACLVQAVLVSRATVPSLDAVRFVTLAERFDQQGLAALRESFDRPVFPLWLGTVHAGLQATVGPFRADWALSAQLAAALALILTVLPVYALSVRLVGREAAFLGTALFCVIPEVCPLGADGLSDSTHLLFFALAVWALLEYWMRREAGGAVGVWTLLAGLTSAAALLTRQEAVTLPLAFLLTLVVFQWLPQRRQPWRRVAGHLAGFAAGIGLLYGTYLAAVHLAPAMPAAAAIQTPFLWESADAEQRSEAAIASWRLPDGEPMSFAMKDPSESLRRRGYLAAAGKFLLGLGGAFGPAAALLAVLGLWFLRQRAPSAADRFVQMLLGVFSCAAIYFCAREGYLTPRHMLVWVVLGCGCAGYGAWELARRLAHWRPFEQRGWSPAGLGVAIVVLAMLGSAGSLLKPVHLARLGHRQAAAWLAAHAVDDGTVLDTQGWTGLYSGCATYRAKAAPQAWCDPRLRYIVLEQRELDYSSSRSRTLRWLLEQGGQQVAVFASKQPREAVVVYRWNAQRLALPPIPWVTTR